jgi:hypothetical protein
MDPFSINAQLIQSLELGIPYLHYKGTRKLVPTSFSDLPVSQLMPAPAHRFVHQLDGLTGYVALPGYLKKNPHGSGKIISDFQLAVTGSGAFLETLLKNQVFERFKKKLVLRLVRDLSLDMTPSDMTPSDTNTTRPFIRVYTIFHLIELLSTQVLLLVQIISIVKSLPGF